MRGLNPVHLRMIAHAQPLSDVLVVDDQPDNLRLLCGMLKARNCIVRPVPSGSMAIDAAESRPPDIVLMDINMPGMNGYEACAELKSREGLRDIPVIFLSALGETIDKVRAFDVGGVDYITKPFKIEEVDARIKTHLAIRRLQAELQDQYEELLKLEKLRDQLTHMIVHDMRNPLAVIMGALHLACNDPESHFSESVGELLELGRSRADVVERMATEMLDIGRMEQKEMPFQPEEHDMKAIINDACKNVVLAGQKLIVEIPEGPIPFRCDGDLVRRIVTNMLGNAVKFTHTGKEIRVTARIVEERMWIEVTDQGTGIAPEYHDLIFEKFGQVDGDHRKEVPSTGLGLTFCRLAVEAHGGHIGLKSSPGEGSTFWFNLPDIETDG